MSTPSANRWAFKEWAVVCAALAAGRQSILIRKGGIAEGTRGFEVDHDAFWLFATRFHQSADELTDEGEALFRRLDAPSPGVVSLPAFVRVTDAWRIDDERRLPELAGLHVLSPRVVENRFHYKRPGLTVLTVRAFVGAAALLIPDSPHFAGCRTWVELPDDLPTGGLRPILDDAIFDDIRQTVASRLSPRPIV